MLLVEDSNTEWLILGNRRHPVTSNHFHLALTINEANNIIVESPTEIANGEPILSRINIEKGGLILNFLRDEDGMLYLSIFRGEKWIVWKGMPYKQRTGRITHCEVCEGEGSGCDYCDGKGWRISEDSAYANHTCYGKRPVVEGVLV